MNQIIGSLIFEAAWGIFMYPLCENTHKHVMNDLPSSLYVLEVPLCDRPL